MNLKHMFASFKPGFDPVSLSEKFRSAIAALLGMFLLGEALHFMSVDGHLLMPFASMAAAAVLIYAAPHSPMAQPWPLVVGNLLSAVVGWVCCVLISDPVFAAACAVGLAILVMHLTHSLHPPGAATAMVMVLNVESMQQYNWMWIGGAVLANIVLSLILAIVINNMIHRGRYPVLHPQYSPTSITGAHTGELQRVDVEWALEKMEGVVDVDEDDLLTIYRLATQHARNN